MNGLQKQTGFSWKHGFFASQSEGLYNHNAPPKDKAKNIKIQCPIVKKNENQTQWNFYMALAIPPHDDLAMATNPASPALLHVAPATILTTEMDNQNYDSMHTTDSCVGKVQPLNVKHDNGHIHQASPIRGLPLEHQKLQILGSIDQTTLIHLLLA